MLNIKKVKSLALIPIFLILSCSLSWGDIVLNGYLHPGDNDFNSFTPSEPLTTDNDHTYNYYLNNPTKFYLSEESNITAVTLVDAVSIDSAIRVYIDGNLVGTGTSGSATIVLDAILSLASGYHDIAARGSCYNWWGTETTCGTWSVLYIDDFSFSALRLTSGQTTTAVDFIQRVHLGDYTDSNDNYDIDDTSNSFYPDAPEATSKEYLLENNITGNLAAFRIFISRMRDVSADGINKIKVYDSANSLITTFDINQSTDYKFDISKLYVGSVNGISKVEILCGQLSATDYDDISFGELIVIPYTSVADIYPKPIINFKMDECSWDSDSNTYEIKNFGSLGSDYNATALNDANVTDGKIYNGGDINATTSSDKAILAKNNITLPNKYTITSWIKFPLNEDGNAYFQEGRGWNRTRVKYFNIADRPGSDNDFIYFKHDTTNDIWSLCIKGNDSDCQSFNPQNLSGWHLLSFVVNSNNSETKFYVDKTETLTFSQAPSGELGLLFNSDYGKNNDNETNGQSIGTSVDEFKIFTGVLSTGDISTIYNNENSGNNYDGTQRNAPQCGNDENETVLNYKFDAWDTWRGINDRNISTKIVKQDFNLTIASLDENGTSFQDFNGTVCVTVDQNTSRFFFSNENNKTATFKISKAIKDIRVNIKWKRDANESSCSFTDGNETNSSDNFAIRPEKFTIINIDNLRAGEEFDFNVSANAKDYNTTVSLEANLTKECSSDGADFNLTSIIFSDGNSTNKAKFEDVGVVDINITDKNWASVDDDDTPQNCNGIWICLDENTTITIFPHHFKVNSSLQNNYSNFTYLSTDLNMSALLDINITAKNEQNGTTENYNSVCYAKDTNFSISYEGINNLNSILWQDINTSDMNETDLNNSISFDKNSSIFTIDNNGTANMKLRINFNRNRSVPVNPFDLNITSIYVVDKNDTNGTGSPDNNATFYYGRVKTKDITTNLKDVNNSLHVEVYSANSNDFVKDFKQESLSWYVMEKDNNQTITDFKDSSKFDSIIDTNIFIDSFSYEKGELSFQIHNPNEVKKAYIHVDIPEYLWYSKYSDYNISGDCSEHPCFLYEYKPVNTQNYIKSGDFNGSTIGRDFNATNVKRGVKVFR